MSIENTRAHIISAVWKAIAQSGADLSSISKEKQSKLVEAIADNLLVTVDDLLGEASQESTQPLESALDTDEHILWKGRPFLSIAENYTITSERVRVLRGVLSREVENFELIRIQDLDFSQKLGERMLGIGDLVIRGHDPSHPELVLRNVRDPEQIYELLRRAWLEARQRHGLQFREEM